MAKQTSRARYTLQRTTKKNKKWLKHKDLGGPTAPTLPTYKIMSPKAQNATMSLATNLRQGEQWNEQLID